jgi:3-dehydroquinate synthase
MDESHRVRVNLGDRSHDVRIGRGALRACASDVATLARGRAAAVLADEHVAALQRERIAHAWEEAGLRTVDVPLPRGEAAKTMSVVESACRRLAALGVEREDVILGIGGGAATDAAGFVAAVYLRGVSFVAVPTSLLGMVDAAVGGKTAVDLPEGKNLIGAFRQPRLVIADLDFLETLPARELRAGFAEMVKIAWIADEDLLARLEEASADLRRARGLSALVARCVAIKAEIVARDERESGERALLNFGHTWGHAIETESRGAVLHGEAVALGMIAATRHSVDSGRCEERDLDRMIQLLDRAGLPTGMRALDPEAIVARMRADKKRKDGTIRVVLTGGVGSASVADDVSEEAVRRAVEFLRREGTRCDLSLD